MSAEPGTFRLVVGNSEVEHPNLVGHPGLVGGSGGGADIQSWWVDPKAVETSRVSRDSRLFCRATDIHIQRGFKAAPAPRMCTLALSRRATCTLALSGEGTHAQWRPPQQVAIRSGGRRNRLPFAVAAAATGCHMHSGGRRNRLPFAVAAAATGCHSQWHPLGGIRCKASTMKHPLGGACNNGVRPRALASCRGV
eukprot:360182-Chlamydomonas_euryale.AAC.5